MKNHKQANLTIHEQQADRSRPIRMGRWDRDSDSNWGRRVSDDPRGRRHPAGGGPPGVSATWRWAPIVGVSLAILILVGAFVTPSTGNRLSERGEVGPFIGT